MSDIDIRYTKKEYAVKRRENDGGERERRLEGREAASGTSLPEVSIIPSSFYNYKPRPNGNAESRSVILP